MFFYVRINIKLHFFRINEHQFQLRRGIPTVALFGSTNPQRTAPLGPRTRVVTHRIECSPCMERTCRFGHYECLTRIDTAEVEQALLDVGALPARP